MNNYNFTVLISVYHRESSDYLCQALHSVFNQTLMPSEVVLVKDGPLTEALDAVIQQYVLIYYDILKIIPIEKNVGLGLALNEGLTHCSYELIMRMDSDDICKNNRFEKQIKFMVANPNIDICSCSIDEFEGDTTNIINTKRLPESHDDLVKWLKSRSPFNHPAVIYKKNIVVKSGGYQHFPLMEDYYLWCRMFLCGARMHNLQESLLYFRTNAEMFSRRGGLKYALTELRFLKYMYNHNILSSWEFLKYASIRFTVRIMPNRLRQYFYTKFLRNN